MRIEVGTVKTISGVALVGAILACGCGLLSPSAALVSPASEAAHVAAAYAVTLLSFAALPRSRRTDLVKLFILTAAVAELAQPALGRSFSVQPLGADICGAFAVLVPSFMERFRSLTRADPHEMFSMVYPNDRRRGARRRAHTQARPSARPLSPAH